MFLHIAVCSFIIYRVLASANFEFAFVFLDSDITARHRKVEKDQTCLTRPNRAVDFYITAGQGVSTDNPIYDPTSPSIGEWGLNGRVYSDPAEDNNVEISIHIGA